MCCGSSQSHERQGSDQALQKMHGVCSRSVLASQGNCEKEMWKCRLPTVQRQRSDENLLRAFCFRGFPIEPQVQVERGDQKDVSTRFHKDKK